jgi:hypothetical protein
MAHFVRTQIDAVWVDGYVMPAADFIDLDSKLFRSINGDEGGLYSPTSPIVVGGSGLTVTGPTVVSGAAASTPGKLQTSGASRFVIGASDWPALSAAHPGRARTLLSSFAAGFQGLPTPPSPATNPLLQLTAPAKRLAGGAGVAAYVPAYDINDFRIAPEFWCPLRVHNGATLTSVDVSFRISTLTGRDALPTTLPKFRIVRVAVDGTIVPLEPGDNGVDGFVELKTRATLEEYFAGGAVQTITLNATQNNVVDVTQYSYFVHVIEETGGGKAWPMRAYVGYPACKSIVLSTSYTLSGTGVPTDSDYTLTAGDRILVAAGTNTDGIYVAAAGAWARASDMPSGEIVLPGSLIQVTHGRAWGGTVWQQSASSNRIVNSQSLSLVQPSVPMGNVFISARASFTGIADLSFQ